MDPIEIIEKIPSEEVALPRSLRSAVEKELGSVGDDPAFILLPEEAGEFEDIGNFFFGLGDYPGEIEDRPFEERIFFEYRDGEREEIILEGKEGIIC
jgi:hypothetical protein